MLLHSEIPTVRENAKNALMEAMRLKDYNWSTEQLEQIVLVIPNLLKAGMPIESVVDFFKQKEDTLGMGAKVKLLESLIAHGSKDIANSAVKELLNCGENCDSTIVKNTVAKALLTSVLHNSDLAINLTMEGLKFAAVYGDKDTSTNAARSFLNLANAKLSKETGKNEALHYAVLYGNREVANASVSALLELLNSGDTGQQKDAGKILSSIVDTELDSKIKEAVLLSVLRLGEAREKEIISSKLLTFIKETSGAGALRKISMLYDVFLNGDAATKEAATGFLLQLYADISDLGADQKVGLLRVVFEYGNKAARKMAAKALLDLLQTKELDFSVRLKVLMLAATHADTKKTATRLLIDLVTEKSNMGAQDKVNILCTMVHYADPDVRKVAINELWNVLSHNVNDLTEDANIAALSTLCRFGDDSIRQAAVSALIQIAKNHPNSDLPTVLELAAEIASINPIITDAVDYNFSQANTDAKNGITRNIEGLTRTPMAAVGMASLFENISSSDSATLSPSKLRASVHAKKYKDNPRAILDLGLRLLREKVGVCDHMAASIITKIVGAVQNGKKWNSTIELVGNKSHAFVIIGRKEGSDIHNPKTWGDNVFLIDPWLSGIGLNETGRNVNKMKEGANGVLYTLEDIVSQIGIFNGYFSNRISVTYTFSPEEIQNLAKTTPTLS